MRGCTRRACPKSSGAFALAEEVLLNLGNGHFSGDFGPAHERRGPTGGLVRQERDSIRLLFVLTNKESLLNIDIDSVYKVVPCGTALLD
jgi:hypothetical protein